MLGRRSTSLLGKLSKSIFNGQPAASASAMQCTRFDALVIAAQIA